MLDNYKELIETCTICHDQCVFACPIFTVERKTTVYPSRKAQIARCLMNGQLDWNEESADLFYHCIGCKLCERWCVYLTDRKDPVPVFKEARKEALKRGVVLDYVGAALDRYRKHGNIYGDLSGSLAGLNKENLEGEDQRVLYLGDSDTLALSPDSARAFIRLLNRLNIKPLVSEQIDTGADALSMGFDDLGKEVASGLAGYINGLDVDTVVVSSPKSYYALTKLYKELGLQITKTVLLEAEYLEQLLAHENIKVKKLEKSGTYQDGIYMARYLKVYDLPRRLIKPMFSGFIELRTNREEAKPAAPEDHPLGLDEGILRGIAEIRLQDIAEADADYIVTSDPFSYEALKKYYDKDRVLSIPELVLMNLCPGK